MALYHKYRPKTFAEVVGQEHVTTTISNQIKNNKISHAYLFSGPRGIGKTTIARILAKSLNCEKIKEGEFTPCNECLTCQEIDKTRSIDVIEMDAATHTQVDNIRENVIENAQFRPNKSKYKIFIIDEVHMLSTASFNALLKTIEEPPKHVIFILATTELNKIPETIISRCQKYNFSKVGGEEMKKHLKKICKLEKAEVDEEVLERIARKSEGCVRDALSILDQIFATNNKKVKLSDVELLLPSANLDTQIEFLEYLLNKNSVAAINFIEKMIDEGQNLSFFSKSFIEFLHFFMIAKADINLAKKEIDLNKNSEKKVSELLNIITDQDLVRLIDLCLKRDAQIKSSPLPQIPLELLILEWIAFSDEDLYYSNKNSEDSTSASPKTDAVNQVNISNDKKINSIDRTETKTEKENICQKVKTAISHKKRNIDFEELKNKWPECLKKIEAESPSLVFILKMANLLDINDNILNLEVGFDFHKEKLTEAEIKTKIENIFSEVFAEKVKIQVKVNSESTQKPVENEIQNLASALGGEVV